MIYEAVVDGEVVKVKKCGRCLKFKSLKAYHRSVGKQFGHSICKKCKAEYDKSRKK